MAQKCEKHSLIQFRRIAAHLYKRNQRWAQSVALSKQDNVYEEAIETAAESGNNEIAEELIDFFVKNGYKACFAATLYTCYPLLRPDVVMELAWRNGLTEYSMPFMIQVMRQMNTNIDSLMEYNKKIEESKAEVKKQEEEALAQGYVMGMDPGYANAMTVHGQNMQQQQYMQQNMQQGYGGYGGY